MYLLTFLTKIDKQMPVFKSEDLDISNKTIFLYLWEET